MDLINVGIMERDNDSILKPVRGKKLPLKLSETSSAGETKVLAIDKHASNNQSFCGLEDYVLLYPDKKEVVHSKKHQLVQERKRENNSHYVNTKWNYRKTILSSSFLSMH